ncbi:hypothetical protein [Phreatobacter sp.]|uniref:hypothetical protein n=1 Tax=Phreatobacter sp. TaxID=1966341 RepID=UPI003F713C09
MAQPLVYIVEIDLPAADRPRNRATFIDWYAHVHAPHLYEAGFTTCTSYQAVDGEMEIVDIYQAGDWSVFESARFARYRRLAAADPHLPAFMPAIANRRTPYVHVPFPSGTEVGDDAPIACDWLTVWRFGADPAAFALAADWLGSGGETRLLAQGAGTVRLLRRTRDAPTGGSDRPTGALVIEWAGRPEPSARSPGALPEPLRTAMAACPSFTGFRLYPWPDDPALRTEGTGIG